MFVRVSAGLPLALALACAPLSAQATIVFDFAWSGQVGANGALTSIDESLGITGFVGIDAEAGDGFDEGDFDLVSLSVTGDTIVDFVLTSVLNFDLAGVIDAGGRFATFFCGCRSVCKEFLIVGTCDRVRTFVMPVRAADMAPLAGMVMRGAGPNLQQRARGTEKVSGLPNPDHVDHVPMLIMPSSQLVGPVGRPTPCQAPISTGPR